ncbi:MAG: hypothetical protein E7339_01660 [Clostridiales bacterium]|nr:hypothetical protein [Clostridiales bacterium]
MIITKIILLAITAALLCYYLKSINSNLFLPALLVSGIVILNYSIDYILAVSSYFTKLFESLKIDSSVFILLLKVCVIGYAIEFSAGLIEDLGIKNLSDKLIFVGKILLLSMSLPIFNSLFDLMLNFIN